MWKRDQDSSQILPESDSQCLIFKVGDIKTWKPGSKILLLSGAEMLQFHDSEI